MLEVQHREDRYLTACYGVREGYQENLLAEAAAFKKKKQKSKKHQGSVVAPSPSGTTTTVNGQADLESAQEQVDDSNPAAALDETAGTQSNSWTSPQSAAAEMER